MYRAQDREHLVAIKTFRLDVPPESAVDMGIALRALVADAPRIDGLVMPVGAGVEGETPWVAMPHVALPTLDTRLRDEGALAIDRALRIVAAIADAIDAAHAHDVHHGSLHPRDVFVDADGRVQITGFGVARALQAVGVRPPVRRPYSAPELVTDRSYLALAAPADHYALGAMAFELLTGHRLLTSGADLAPRLYRADGARVDPAAAALAAMLAERPEHRPARASAFAFALSRALGPAGESSAPVAPVSEPARTDAEAGLEEGASDEALQLFARKGTLWEPRAEPVREVWAEAAPVGEETPTLVAAEPPRAANDRVAPEPLDLDEIPNMEAPRSSAADRLVPEPPARLIAPDRAPGLPPREIPIDLPIPGPAPILSPAGDPDGATGSPPAVVLALVLALGLAIGGAGGYLLGQRSGMRAAMRAQGGEVALTDEPRQLGEPAPDAAAEPPAPATPDPAERSRLAPAPARERLAPVEGQILVRSTPARAGVLVNGLWRGRTPLTVARLPLGTHAVRVVEDGHVPETRRVTLDARVPSATVSVQLERLAPARAGAPAAPRPGATTGGLYLESRPTSARVFVDGQLVGTTPLLVAELAPGSHVVRIEHPGHRPWSTTVTIAAGQRSRVAASLEEGSEEQRP